MIFIGDAVAFDVVCVVVFILVLVWCDDKKSGDESNGDSRDNSDSVKREHLGGGWFDFDQARRLAIKHVGLVECLAG